MTASDLQNLLITALVRQQGGDRRRWRLVIGDVRVHDVATHAHCNWSVVPSGSPADIDAAEGLVDDLRQSHPIVAAR